MVPVRLTQLSGVLKTLTGQFADKPIRGQSSRGLVNSSTAKYFFKTERLHYAT